MGRHLHAEILCAVRLGQEKDGLRLGHPWEARTPDGKLRLTTNSLAVSSARRNMVSGQLLCSMPPERASKIGAYTLFALAPCPAQMQDVGWFVCFCFGAPPKAGCGARYTRTPPERGSTLCV